MNLEQEFISNIKKHKGIVVKVVSLYADLPDDKADLEQEILYQAWKSFARFKRESKFSTWLYRVALNTALTFRKIHNRSKKHIPIDKVDIDYTDKSNSDEKNQLYWAIKQLNSIDKTIVTLHLEGFDNTEIAKMIGINRNSLNVKLHRIKNKIVEQLKKEAHGLA